MGPLLDEFKQAYGDITYAKRDCMFARRFFQKHYNVLDKNIIEI